MAKFLGLDLGDGWTGISISDALGMLAQPYETVAAKNLEKRLPIILEKEKIETVVIGYPITMGGKISEQTKKVIEYKEKLEELFPSIKWILWDERLSSKRAERLKKARNKEEKKKRHALAAAFILESYLTYQNI